MSMFIRRYAKYLNTKALSYRTVAFDFTKIKRGYVLHILKLKKFLNYNKKLLVFAEVTANCEQ